MLSARSGGCFVGKGLEFSDEEPLMAMTPEECLHALIRAILRDIRKNCGADVLHGVGCVSCVD